MNSRLQLPDASNPFGDWTANPFTAPTQYIFLSNTMSLYSVVIPGKGITTGATFSSKTVQALEKFIRGRR